MTPSRPSEARRGGAKEMGDALSEARLSDAIELFESQRAPSAEASLVRARIYLKKRQYGEAIEFLNRLSGGALSRVQSAEVSMLLAVAHSRANRFDEADEYFAAAALPGSRIVESGELAYWRGRRFLEERRPEDALAQVEQLRESVGDQARIFTDLLESGILTQQYRYTDAALKLLHLLEFMDGLRSEHREEEIWALHTLAVLARELDAPRIRRFVQSRVKRQEWTDDFRVNEFQTYKAVAWCHALEGDYLNCFRYLRLAGAIAPSAPWRAMTLLDRAYLARCVREPITSRAELAEAEDLLESIPWRQTDDEERVALVLAAELCAEVDAPRAASYLVRFFELRDAMNPQLHLRYDERLIAHAEYVSGIVQMNLGNRKSAFAAFKKAWKVYDAIGYDWRAGRCALRLYELTQRAQWQERAREKLRNYVGSWLYEELREGSDLPRITPAQRRVLDLLVAGKTTELIAETTGTAPATIQNHVKAMLAAFNAPNRSALVAEAMKRGVGAARKTH